MLKPFERMPFADLPEEPRKPHDLALAAQRFVDVESAAFGNIKVAYRELGDGPPLLLVHGLMTSSYSWRYVIGALAKRYRVIAPDLPGAGGTTAAPDREHTPRALATLLAELIRALKIEGCRVVGNSLGGFVCMHLALAEPTLVEALVNVHSPAMPELRYGLMHGGFAIPGVKSAFAWFVQRDPDRWVWKNVHYWDETLKSREELRAYGDVLQTDDGVRSFIRYLTDALGPRGFTAFAAALAERHAANQAFPVPLLLLYARRDALVRPENGDLLKASIPSAELVWLDDTSHFAHVDTPLPVVKEILAFFDAVSSRR